MAEQRHSEGSTSNFIEMSRFSFILYVLEG